MFVRDVGHGDAILLLHGTPSPAADWAPLVDVLSAKYRVLVPEYVKDYVSLNQFAS